MVPDVWNLIGYLQDAMAEMVALVPEAAPARPAKKAAARRTAGRKPPTKKAPARRTTKGSASRRAD
jgi:hypothetical protein